MAFITILKAEGEVILDREHVAEYAMAGFLRERGFNVPDGAIISPHFKNIRVTDEDGITTEYRLKLPFEHEDGHTIRFSMSPEVVNPAPQNRMGANLWG